MYEFFGKHMPQLVMNKDRIPTIYIWNRDIEQRPVSFLQLLRMLSSSLSLKHMHQLHALVSPDLFKRVIS